MQTIIPPQLADLRPDLQAVAELIPAGASVLDLGCGDGALLAYLVGHKGVRGRGIELSEDGVLACVRRGLSVRQGNLEEGLAGYPTVSFDYVLLSQTLPFLDDPAMILRETLRVGQQAIVSLPNWAYWRCRLSLLWNGRIPEAPDYPQAWHVVPRWQALTISDFIHLCRKQNMTIRKQLYLAKAQRIRFLPNFFARTAVFVLTC
jgi:methionine biosynthesis protein MetW